VKKPGKLHRWGQEFASKKSSSEYETEGMTGRSIRAEKISSGKEKKKTVANEKKTMQRRHREQGMSEGGLGWTSTTSKRLEK